MAIESTENYMTTGSIPKLICSDTDDPRVVAEAATEDYSLHVMPRSWRLGKFRLLMAWSSIIGAMFWLIVGAQVAGAVGTRDALIGIGLSALAYGVICYIFATVGSRHGITVALLSRGLFGYQGASLATLVFAAGAIYFAAFEASVLAVAFMAQFGGSLKLWYLITMAYQIPLVIGGVRRWLDRLNAALLPIYFIGLVAAIVWAISKHGYSDEWLNLPAAAHSGIVGPGWMFAFTTYMGVWLAMFYSVDFGRFGRSRDEKFTGAVTFGPVFWFVCLFLNAMAGILLVTLLPPNAGGLTGQIIQLMGGFGLVLIFVSQTKVNSANLYMASSNLESFCERALHIRVPRWIWAIVTGVVVYLLMLADVFSFLLKALNYQAVVVVAWVGIALVEFGVRRALRQPVMDYRPGRVVSLNINAVIAWTVSSAVGIVLLARTPSLSGTWGAPIAFALAVVLYLGLRLTFGNRNDQVSRPHDPRAEVSDMWEVRVECHKCTKFYIAVEMDRDPTAGYQTICASCATDTEFLNAAHRELSADR